MCSSNLNLLQEASGYENSCLNPSDETFTILSFADLDFCSSPCLNENLIYFPQKNQLKMENMEAFMEKTTAGGVVVEGVLPCLSPPVAQLSPGVDFSDYPLGPDWFLENLTKADLTEGNDPVEELTTLLDSETDLGALGLNKEGEGWSAVEVSTHQEGQVVAGAWLTQSTISTDQLMLSGLIAETISSEAGGKKVPQKTSIPSAVEVTSLLEIEDPDYNPLNEDGTNQSSSGQKSRKRARQNVEPGTEEYKKKREQNNISVRKSREKARKKQQDTEERVEILSTENSRLQERVDTLEKEITILRGLFSNIGATLPPEITKFLSAE